ncbi:hypothetical protein BASA50_004449 [Batrachochytrium salamandrivorans]|uniref:HTH APSES-type domain-containing protein n=1 Tax=Batrachochytrium salamandrivorans TaxID=1357716 RepID=A0ABQ8FIV2_9FUNG|nr:hypothetical protein BASA62_004414 [Batrachochytrium salamandrivorans]KAH6581237.1 hypothetical protein BASA60_002514 [Batrachochytrium salamandrivorans]KAH6588160.1 hypothetical protein BASA61_006065 [Batrachochytrium salamandrivorans]KAH6597532.1 hypothetical protein BASA50_004449 [Batrachochytrium salamandrivorans]KAH9254335.1 hypothetical protein BASA81_007617 [Batrachochytrium salamandrivorans]
MPVSPAADNASEMDVTLLEAVTSPNLRSSRVVPTNVKVENDDVKPVMLGIKSEGDQETAAITDPKDPTDTAPPSESASIASLEHALDATATTATETPSLPASIPIEEETLPIQATVPEPISATSTTVSKKMGKSYTSTPAKSTKSHSAKKAAAMASANTPTVRSACYSGVIVYEVKARNNVPVMRRKVDSYINATQILRAAGLPKPARTKVLEKDVSLGLHEKIQGGYAGFQGTWVPLKSAIALAEAYKVGDELRTLFEYDTKSGEAEKHVVARVKRSAPIATRREAGGDSSNDSSSEGDELDRPRRTPSRTPRHAPTPPTSIRSPRTRRKRLFSAETADEDDNTHRDREVITGGRTARTAAITKAAAYRSLSTPKRLIQEGRSEAATNNTSAHPVSTSSAGRGNTATSMATTASATDATRHRTTASRQGDDSSQLFQICGVTDTPQWRRGSSGKRTLYNACDAKWSSDRLASHSASPTGNQQMSISSDSDSVDSSSLSSPLGELDLEVGSTAWSLSLEVQGLKMKLRDMERGQQRLRKLLLEAKIDDRDIDRGYRKVIHAAKRSRSDDDGDIYGWEGDFSHDDRVPQQLEENDSGDACGDSYPRGFSEMESQNRCSRSAVLTASKVSRRFNNESERDRQHEQLAIGRFVRAVKRSKSKMMDRIRSMRLPLQPLS